MEIVKQLEDLLIENNWSILEDFSDSPIEGKIEYYDISGMTFTDEFEINLYYLKTENIFVHKMFKMDGTTFSNLRIYVENPIEIFKNINNWSKKISKDNFVKFVREIHSLSKNVIFNDNGVWVKIKFKK